MIKQVAQDKSNTLLPLVSCLCVTEGRSVFMPWLIWSFDRQRWTHRELVIIDSSKEPLQSYQRNDIRILTAPFGITIAKKRNQAIREAHGEIITWFDDDDWQHPNKLVWLVAALTDGVPYAGSTNGWFVDIMHWRCCPYQGGAKRILFNSAGFQRDAAASIKFNENLRQASDTTWMNEIAAKSHNRPIIINKSPLFFWLCHQRNISNPASKRHYTQNLEFLKNLIGSEDWGDTDSELGNLQSRLQIKNKTQSQNPGHAQKRTVTIDAPMTVQVKTNNATQDKQMPSGSEGELPPIGLMIKATVMDTPFLDIMVRHMISQARYPFAERTIIVDHNPTFRSKYQNRNRSSTGDLDRILNRLMKDRIVDCVREVDMHPDRIKQIMGRYFTSDSISIPTHAITGGPIYPTLFGLESMPTDFVLQMDADVFFYTAGGSWVQEALKYLLTDSSLWLMMTHPGPPAGPPGKSLGIVNSKRAIWDKKSEIWRFATATTRYFLCDRRKLYGRLRPIFINNECAPLEQCISASLKKHGVYRGALGNLKSWHLHAWYHAHPFPQWAPFLAKIIENGIYPAFQKGNYDLRLDLGMHRREWEKILGFESGKKSVREHPIHDICQALKSEHFPAKVVTSSIEEKVIINPEKENITPDEKISLIGINSEKTLVKQSSIAVVIPVRDRAGQRLKNSLNSLLWQSAGRPLQILIVSHGSQPEVNRELADICSENSVTLITNGKPTDPWNKPLALNIGIRATFNTVHFIMTMDIDMILAPNFIQIVLERLSSKPNTLVLCRSSDMPSKVKFPQDSTTLMNEYHRLQRLSSLHSTCGTGGIQAATRSFFLDIRGYDEALLWWGAMDGDMVRRAQLAGMTIDWIENQTSMLHQWHPCKYNVLNNATKITQAKNAWNHNHALIQSRSNILVRNIQSWGAMAD